MNTTPKRLTLVDGIDYCARHVMHRLCRVMHNLVNRVAYFDRVR